MSHKVQSAARPSLNSPDPAAGGEPAAKLTTAKLLPALRSSLRATWDRLGLVAALSLSWTILALLSLGVPGRLLPAATPIALRAAALTTLWCLVTAPALAGVFRVAHLVLANDEVGYGDAWVGALRMLPAAAALAAIHLVVIGGIALNIRFYWALGGAAQIAAMLCAYVFLFWLMMSVYHLPLLAAQEMGLFDTPERRVKRGVRAVIRRAFYLTIGDPIFTAGVLCAAAALTLALAVTAVLAPLLWAGSLALLLTAATRELLMKYEVLPRPATEEPLPDHRAFNHGSRPKPSGGAETDSRP